VHVHPERYTAETLLTPSSKVSVKHQRLRHVDVHWHDFYELAYVVKGCAVHRVNGVAHQVLPGSIFLLTPADFHELESVAGTSLDCYNVVIDAFLLEDTVGHLLPSGLDATAWTLHDCGDLEGYFRRIHEERQAALPGAGEMTHALLQCLLVEFTRRCASVARTPDHSASMSDNSSMRRAVRFIDRHFREQLTLAGVAAQAHLSPNYFSERFREFTGTSFQTYLQQRRLHFARSLLASTGLGVTEVCHAAGFNSLSHFGRAYRNRYGESPTAFRTSATRPSGAPVLTGQSLTS
jgi:AraC-like DNA-binding protein